MKIKLLPILIILMLAFSGCGMVKQTVSVSTTDSAAATVAPEPEDEPAPSPVAEPTPESTDESSDVEDADVTGADSDTDVSETPYEREAKRDLLALMMAYPNQIMDLEKGEDGLIYVVMSSGCKIVYDDMQSKSFEEKLDGADLSDTMELAYPLEDIDTLMEGDFDPGRFRNYDFLMDVYGDSETTVEANLQSVEAGPETCLFNGKNGAAGALTAVFFELSDIIRSDSTISEFVYPMSGTYNYRVIAGTERLSPHAFAIAIDLKNDITDYWREATREQGQTRLDVFPKEIVRIFEENGFIWGGKWAHFDLLHFEYRPELIIKAEYYTEQEDGQIWYQGYPQTNETFEFIEIIEMVFADN